jgi:hypothetical protein
MFSSTWKKWFTRRTLAPIRRTSPFRPELEHLEDRKLLSTAVPAVINYGSGSSEVENVFAVGSDGNLYVDHYEPGSGWSWVNQGSPGRRFVSNPVIYPTGPASRREPFVALLLWVG